MVWKLVWQNSLELLFYIKKVIYFSSFSLLFGLLPLAACPCARAHSWAAAHPAPLLLACSPAAQLHPSPLPPR